MEHTDLSESVDAVGRAVNVVKKQAGSKAQAMMQLKVVSYVFSNSELERILF